MVAVSPVAEASANLPAHLYVVVPGASIERMTQKGFRFTDRANGFTMTMYQIFDTDTEAMQAGRKLPFVWCVDHPKH